MSGAHVILDSVSHGYAETTILSDVDLVIEPGQIVAVVGPSGVGKSTLLRLIAGEEAPQEGTLGVIGPDGEATIRTMYQEDRLLPWRRLRANVMLGAPERGARADELIRSVGLSGREDAWPAELSGGMKQRAALARALLHEPDLLLLDEPFGALDAITRVQVQQLVEQLWQRSPTTILLVTHDVEEALVLADRVIVLAPGRIARDLTVPLPRPRPRGHADLAALKADLLQDLLTSLDASPAYARTTSQG